MSPEWSLSFLLASRKNSQRPKHGDSPGFAPANLPLQFDHARTQLSGFLQHTPVMTSGSQPRVRLIRLVVAFDPLFGRDTALFSDINSFLGLRPKSLIPW
jgi:hypothetical protein